MNVLRREQRGVDGTSNGGGCLGLLDSELLSQAEDAVATRLKVVELVAAPAAMCLPGWRREAPLLKRAVCELKPS